MSNNNAQRLAEIREQMKALKKEESKIVEEFKELGEGVYEDGEFLVNVTSESRQTLDSKRLEAILGDLSEYKKRTDYMKVSVKEACVKKVS